MDLIVWLGVCAWSWLWFILPRPTIINQRTQTKTIFLTISTAVTRKATCRD